MAHYIVIGGNTANHMEKLFKSATDIEIKYSFNNPKMMADELLEKGSAFLSDIDAILITDYGFKSADYSKRYNEFILLQDALSVNNIDQMNVYLYLATKDTDLYRELKTGNRSIPPFLYLYAEAYLIEGKTYQAKQLVDILRGSKQKRGLFNPDVNNRNIEARLKENTAKFIEESKVYDTNIVKMSKEDEKGSFTNLEFINSIESEEHIAREATDMKKREKALERERLKEKRKKKTNVREDVGDEEFSGSINLVIESRGRGNKSEVQADVEISKRSSAKQETHSLQDTVKQDENYTIADEHYADIQKMVKDFTNLAFKSGYNVRGKLESDSGILAFTSYGKQGASSLVANFADIYALSNKKVLVIDLDIKKKTQTKIYFKNYDEEVKKHYGVEDGLVKVINGGALQREVVEINSSVSVLGLSPKIKISQEDVDNIVENIDFVLEDAKSLYDIVLVDIPENLYTKVYPRIVDIIDKNIFVIDNNFENFNYFVEDYLMGLESQDSNAFTELVDKSEVIINKYNNKYLDSNGKESGTRQLHNTLTTFGSPYDEIKIVGELPYFDNWDTQFSESLRYVWLNEKAMGMYRYVLGKVVW